MDMSSNYVDATLAECNKIAAMFMNCEFAAIQKICDHNDDILVNCISRIAMSIESLMTMDEEKCKKASKLMNKLLVQVNGAKNKSWRNYFSSNYYDLLTDEEVHYELIYCEMQIFCALLASVADPTFSAFVSAAFHVKSAHSGFYKCKKILEHRTTWTSELSKSSFEAGTLFGLSLFELMISFLPGRFIRLVELFGFCGNREEALANMRQAVTAGQSTPRSPFISIMFGVYYSFLEYYFGLGHDFTEELDNIMHIVNYRFKDSPFADLLNGLTESSKGNLTIGNELFKRALQNAHFLREICLHQMFWNHVFLCDWAGAVANMRDLRSSKFSRAAFSFNEGVCLKMLLEENSSNNNINKGLTVGEDENNTEEEVCRLVRQVRSFKKTFGGSRAFHEQLVLLRSDQNQDNTDGLFLSPFDTGYIFNYFRLFVKKADVKANIMKVIENREKSLKPNDYLFQEKSAVALFLKAVVKRQMQEYEESIKLFEEVLDMNLNDQFSYLKANAHYELGLIFYEIYEESEIARSHFKKAKSTPNQVSKQMIEHKVAIVMDLIRNKQTI